MTDGASAALVRHAVEGGIATVTLDSPHNRNALSARLRSKLLEQLMAALSNESVRVVVLTHAGPVFCAGADLKEASSAVPPVGAEFTSILEAIWLSPKPVVARVAGPARAGGLGLVAACDIALASQAATFALTEVHIGVVAAVISVTLLPRLLPRAAQELFLTGETFDAKRAVAVGLLNRAVPAYDLDEEVRRYADMLALGAPNALAASKELLRQSKASSIGNDLAAMRTLSERHFASEEGRERIQSFVEKRPAAWVPRPEL